MRAFRQQPIHPELAQIPAACFGAAVAGDIVSIWYERGFFTTVDAWLIGLGVLSGAAVTARGFSDFAAAPFAARTRPFAVAHFALSAGSVIIFGLALAERSGDPQSPLGYALTAGGFVTTLLASWFGGELVFRHLAGALEE